MMDRRYCRSMKVGDGPMGRLAGLGMVRDDGSVLCSRFEVRSSALVVRQDMRSRARRNDDIMRPGRGMV